MRPVDPRVAQLMAGTAAVAVLLGPQLRAKAEPPAARHGSRRPAPCGGPATLIHAIQGSAASSPMLGQTVEIEGVVVGDMQDQPLEGLFVQEEDVETDATPATSEGIFVHQGKLVAPVDAGDVVRVRGEVAEFRGLTELTRVTSVVRCQQSGKATAVPLSFPVARVSDLERLEGMLVQLAQELVVTGNYNWGRYGSLDLAARARLIQPTQVAEPGADALALQDVNDRSRILLDDANRQQNPNPIPYKDAWGTRRVGDSIRDLTAVLSGVYDEYRLQPLGPIRFTSQPRPAVPETPGGRLRVAAFNLYNFFTTPDGGQPACGPSKQLGCRGADTKAEYERQRAKLVLALQLLSADVVVLGEAENNASASLNALVRGLNQRAGAGTYAFVKTGSIGTDAIKVGFLFRPGQVRTVGKAAVLDSSIDARFLDKKNRPVLAQTFEEVATGERFTVVGVHLKSKGSSCADVGDPDKADGQGNCNRTRTRAVEAIVDWLKTDPTQSGDPDFLVMGDFNAYAKEDPIDVIVAAGYEPLVETRIGAQAVSYVFAGQGGYLDHALSSASLSPQVTGVSEWHINADEPRVLDYNTEYKTDDPFNPNDPFRASDHDPLIVGLFGPPAGAAGSSGNAGAGAVAGAMSGAGATSGTGANAGSTTGGMSAGGNKSPVAGGSSPAAGPARDQGGCTCQLGAAAAPLTGPGWLAFGLTLGLVLCRCRAHGRRRKCD